MKAIAAGLLEEMTQRLVAEFRPEQIFLFGSHAWGTPTEDSDVDLMVILPGEEKPTIQDEVRAGRCLRDLSIPKDVLLRSRPQVERYRHLRASLEHQVLQQGKLLYGSLPNDAHPR